LSINISSKAKNIKWYSIFVSLLIWHEKQRLLYRCKMNIYHSVWDIENTMYLLNELIWAFCLCLSDEEFSGLNLSL
jgi:hypothetical protein